MANFKIVWPSDLKGGKTLEQALRSFSDPVQLAQLARMEAPLAPFIDAFGPEVVMQGLVPVGVRVTLEQSLGRRLQSGDLIATASVGKSLFSERKLIIPFQWAVLKPNYDNSTATDMAGTTIHNVEVFERQALFANAPLLSEAPSKLAATGKSRVAIISKGFAKVLIDEQTLSFGAKQAKALSELHAASLEGKPWLDLRQLLERAGSGQFSLSDLFRGKNWQQLIEEGRLEDGHDGQVRLRADLTVRMPDPVTN